MKGPETIDPEDDETVGKKTTHTKCKSGADVVVFAFENAGHTWPKGLQYAPKIVIGRTSQDVDATKEMWSFFRQHALPGYP
jgi:polyhydroxybutyrate depolymerase